MNGNASQGDSMTIDPLLIELSRRYGKNPDMVLAGGGNTSHKTDRILTVKASGHKLATIGEQGFVRLDRQSLAKMWQKTYSADSTLREQEVLSDLLSARLPGETNRPSVESQLHDLFSSRYVLHLHPALVNGVTCAIHGKDWTNTHLGHHALWIDATKPGYLLAMACRTQMAMHQSKTGIMPSVLLLENHGVFFAGDTIAEIDRWVAFLMEAIARDMKTDYDFSDVEIDPFLIGPIVTKLQEFYPEDAIYVDHNRTIMDLVQDDRSVQPVLRPFTPDHIVYCRHRPLWTTQATLAGDLEQYRSQESQLPRIVLVKGLGMFSVGESSNEASTARELFLDQIKISRYAQSFGGPKPMSEEDIDFIRDWEVEHYRLKLGAR
jgi:rhamnose utilization protein RhaD (predicted bifunctional aldolase and dehydrogenase)